MEGNVPNRHRRADAARGPRAGGAGAEQLDAQQLSAAAATLSRLGVKDAELLCNPAGLAKGWSEARVARSAELQRLVDSAGQLTAEAKEVGTKGGSVHSASVGDKTAATAQRRQRRPVMPSVEDEQDEYEERRERELQGPGGGQKPQFLLGKKLDFRRSVDLKRDTSKMDPQQKATHRLQLRRVELFETEESFLLGLAELQQQLEAFVLSHGGIERPMPGGSDGRARKRDQAKDALKKGAEALFGVFSPKEPEAVEGAWSPNELSPPDRLSASGGHSTHSPWGWQRLSVNPSAILSSWGLHKRASQESLKETLGRMIYAVSGLLDVHKGMLQSMERTCVLESVQPLSVAFQDKAEDLVNGHLVFIAAAEAALPLLQAFDSVNRRSWLDRLIRPAQRVTKYQLFLEELASDTEALGQKVEAQAVRSLADGVKSLINSIDRGRCRRHCQETTAVIMEANNFLDLSTAKMLRSQEELLLALHTKQVVEGAGKGKPKLEPRHLVIFQSCIAVLEMSCKIVQVVHVSRLEPDSLGHVTSCSAVALEELNKHLRSRSNAGEPEETLQLLDLVLTAPKSAMQDVKAALAKCLIQKTKIC